MPIVTPCDSVEEIRTRLRQTPLGGVRQMLPDSAILEACQACKHHFRRRRYDPVVTVLHYLAQAFQREESFAATWHDLWAPAAADVPAAAQAPPDTSGLTHARCRLPAGVLQTLAAGAIRHTEQRGVRWRSLRLLALDGTTVSMPRSAALFAHYGAHRARTTTVRYPLARFCSLLAVGTSTVVDYRFGPFTTSETAMATEMLSGVGPGDLVLADRYFAGSPTLARLQARGADFLNPGTPYGFQNGNDCLAASRPGPIPSNPSLEKPYDVPGLACPWIGDGFIRRLEAILGRRLSPGTPGRPPKEPKPQKTVWCPQ